MVNVGKVVVAHLLGEVLWLRWWQQCITTAIYGVLRKGSVATLVQVDSATSCFL